MASEPSPRPAAATEQPLPARWGLSGKLLIIGGAVGILCAFLPLVSVTVEIRGFGSTAKSAKVVDDWRGQVGLIGYFAAAVLAVVLYPPGGLKQKALCWAGLGVGALVALLALWLLILAFDVGDKTDMMGMGQIKSSVGLGAFLNVLAAGTVAAGGFLKARDEKLF